MKQVKNLKISYHPLLINRLRLKEQFYTNRVKKGNIPSLNFQVGFHEATSKQGR